MDKFIPLSVPNLKGNELKYAKEAIEAEWVSTGGAFIDRFERSVAEYLRIDSAVACQSGTAGIHLALRACNVGDGDEVIVPTLTFIAAVNPIRYQNAEPVFMDCDDSLNMDLEKLEEFLREECQFANEKLINKKTRKHIKAIIIVHVFGNIADMERLVKITKSYKLKLIEDATEALGSYYISSHQKKYYAGTIGDYGIYSFNGNKIITTGGGGMVVAKNKEDLKKIKYLSTQAKDNELYYIHHEVGYNYRMTNLQAAIGLAQIEKLEKFIDIKEKNYLQYKRRIEKIDGLDLLDFNSKTRPNYWFYSIIIDKAVYGQSRDELLNSLSREKIQTRPIWGLIHKQKPYLYNQSYKIQRAEEYIEVILNLPCSTNLQEEEVNYVCDLLESLGSI